MKTIGLIGGADPDVTAEYYRLLSLGVMHDCRRMTPHCAIWSCDPTEVRRLQQARDENGLVELFMDAAIRLDVAGADLLLICGVTHHDLAEHVQRAVSIPLLHFADPVAERLRTQRVDKVGLLDMAPIGPDVHEGPMSMRYGIEVFLPTAAERAAVERAEYLEFVVQSDPTARRDACQAIMARMTAEGAQAILFERTDAHPALRQGDCPVPMIDTVSLHVEAAMRMALEP